MSTPKLPFYEKDAIRWRDMVVAMMYELADIKRCCNLSSITNRIGDQVQQCAVLSESITDAIDRRRVRK